MRKIMLLLSAAMLSTLVPELTSAVRADGIFPDKKLEAVVRKYVFEKRFFH